MKVTLIGTGKVAQSLAHALHSQQLLYGVHGRDILQTKRILQDLPGAKTLDNLDFAKNPSTVYLLAVSDRAIEIVAQQFDWPQAAIVAHTSGTTDLAALDSCPRGGVFYPLQSFAQDSKIDWAQTPLLIEGGDSATEETLLQLAQQLSSKAQQADRETRQLLHVAAVFASNFTNRMLYAAGEILSESKLDLQVLESLVSQSVRNVFIHGPQEALTGPAQRDDQSTIQHHLKLLAQNPSLQLLYQRLTDYIEYSKPQKR
ncbi:hypothetical protein BFP72_14695 [Reichenbachiella sp. 5M10]|uniref:Rossmann-like and DUF2520 domain-containing protein n=1 Tax=Reichenbachiella sp. 5M10 TaxID=1889772 RepID=UPI000C1500C7|nr:Rossmann-like and DUF2520 domain-containing protein [Reichenbachiella sp. 5M10]PIB36560.1 hypothetical protein BFP72_14695 [Reichenbachiella sp. 5M10]